MDAGINGQLFMLKTFIMKTAVLLETDLSGDP